MGNHQVTLRWVGKVLKIFYLESQFVLSVGHSTVRPRSGSLKYPFTVNFFFCVQNVIFSLTIKALKQRSY